MDILKATISRVFFGTKYIGSTSIVEFKFLMKKAYDRCYMRYIEDIQ